MTDKESLKQYSARVFQEKRERFLERKFFEKWRAKIFRKKKYDEGFLERKYFDKWRWKFFQKTWRNKPGEEIRNVMIGATGENILHYLAREGEFIFLKELCQSKLVHEDQNEKRVIFDALRQVDNFGDTPMLSAFNAPKSGMRILQYLLSIISTQTKNRWLQKETMLHTNKNKDTILTKLTSYKSDDVQGVAVDKTPISESKKLLYTVFIQYYGNQKSKCFYKIFTQILQNNSIQIDEYTVSNILNDLRAISHKLELHFFDENIFQFKNEMKNTILMELAKKGQDDALKELMSDRNTKRHLTHVTLQEQNNQGQTLLSIMELNRANLTESLAFVLRKEYEFHKKDMLDAEQCIAKQVDSSDSAFKMIQDLNGVENSMPCWYKLQIFIILFIFSLIPTIAPTISDISADTFLSLQYYNEWVNETRGDIVIDDYGHNDSSREEHCTRCRSEWWNGTLGIEAPTASLNATVSNTTADEILLCYDVCFSPKSKFWYTTSFIWLQLVFYLAEFITLTDKYEVTGLRKRVQEAWKDIAEPTEAWYQRITRILKFIFLLIITAIVIILWLPICGFIKFFVDYKYETANEYTRVKISERKKKTDFTAGRSELIEVNAESSTEPIIQSYIIFPNIYHIIQKIRTLITFNEGNLQINTVEFTGIELTQLFAIITSVLSLAWCYSEYHSVKKKYYLDPCVSPLSRILMFLFMLLLIISRLLLFQLFAFYWEPGTIYPVFVFLLIHMVLCSILHVFFSEEILHIKKGQYLKFIHNVLMNALGTIYFHNFFQMDEAQKTNVNDDVEAPQIDINEDLKNTLTENQEKEGQYASQPGRHFSTYERQKYFGLLYFIEFFILMYFGLSSYLVKNAIIGYTQEVPNMAWYEWWLIWVILLMIIVGVILRLVYYCFLHIWRNSICTFTRIKTRKRWNGRLRQYVIESQNTWFLGKVKTFQSTLLILPEELVTLINDQFKQLSKMVTDKINEDFNLITSTKYWRTNLGNMKKGRKILSFILGPILFFLGIMITLLVIIILLVLLILSLVFVIPIVIITKLFITSFKKIITWTPMKEDDDFNSKIIIKFHYYGKKNKYISIAIASPEKMKEWLNPLEDPLKQLLMENSPERREDNANVSVDLQSNKLAEVIIRKLEVIYKKPLKTRSWDPNSDITTRYEIFEQLTCFLPYTKELVIDGLLYYSIPQDDIRKRMTIAKTKRTEVQEKRTDVFQKFGKSMTKQEDFKHLALINCSIFTGQDLFNPQFVDGLETLQSIDFSNNKDTIDTNITTDKLQILEEVAKKNNLKKFVLQNANLEEKEINKTLVALFGYLEVVDLNGCILQKDLIPKIKEEVSSHIGEKTTLKELDLRNCTNLKEEQVKTLHQIKSFGDRDSSLFINFGELSNKSAKFDQNVLFKEVTDNLKDTGILDLSLRYDALKDEQALQTIVDFTSKLSKKKYKMKILNLNNCQLDQEKLKILAPLISQFHTVQLGGKQGFMHNFPEGIDYVYRYLYLLENRDENTNASIDRTGGTAHPYVDSSGNDVVVGVKGISNLMSNIFLRRLEFKSHRYTRFASHDSGLTEFKEDENNGCFDKGKKKLLKLSSINEAVDGSKNVEDMYKAMKYITKFIPHLDELVLDGFPHVQDKQLYDKNLLEEIFRIISQRSNPMKLVSLRDCNIKKLPINEDSLKGLFNIKEIDLSGNDIEKESWNSMANFLETRSGESKLLSLIFQSHTFKKSIKINETLVGMINKIEKIDFRGSQFEDGVIDRFVKEIKGDTHLDLSGCNISKQHRENVKDKNITLSPEAKEKVKDKNITLSPEAKD